MTQPCIWSSHHLFEKRVQILKQKSERVPVAHLVMHGASNAKSMGLLGREHSQVLKELYNVSHFGVSAK